MAASPSLPPHLFGTAVHYRCAEVFRVSEGEMVQTLTLVEMPPTFQTKRGPLQSPLITIIKHYKEPGGVNKQNLWACSVQVHPWAYGHAQYRCTCVGVVSAGVLN